MTVAAVVEAVRVTGCPKVTITGGEPLFHPNFSVLLEALLAKRLRVSVETNGTILPPPVYDEVSENPLLDWVFDYKLPSSGMAEHRLNDEVFPLLLPPRSWIKFVISTEEDFTAAMAMVDYLISDFGFDGEYGPRLAFSPCMGTPGSITPEDLVSRLIDRKLFHVVVNCQVHKFLFQGGEGFRKVTG
jgi:organic radical activating enzyme